MNIVADVEDILSARAGVKGAKIKASAAKTCSYRVYLISLTGYSWKVLELPLMIFY